MTFAVEACRLFLSIRLGRWEFFAQPKSSPAYDACHDRGPFSFSSNRQGPGHAGEVVIEVPRLAFCMVKHRL